MNTKRMIVAAMMLGMLGDTMPAPKAKRRDDDRDDEGRIAAAEEKRRRKAAKRLAQTTGAAE